MCLTRVFSISLHLFVALWMFVCLRLCHLLVLVPEEAPVPSVCQCLQTGKTETMTQRKHIPLAVVLQHKCPLSLSLSFYSHDQDCFKLCICLCFVGVAACVWSSHTLWFHLGVTCTSSATADKHTHTQTHKQGDRRHGVCPSSLLCFPINTQTHTFIF